MNDRELYNLCMYGFVAFVLWLVFMLARGLYVETQCLRAGYPDSKVTAIGTAYCVRRVDQTDEVIPLSSVR